MLLTFFLFSLSLSLTLVKNVKTEKTFLLLLVKTLWAFN
jgi:hypothetical protein